MRSVAVAACLTLVAGGSVDATTVIVPDEVPTIQEGVALERDTILVRPGRYPEVVTGFRGALLRRLVSDGSQERPVLDGFQGRGHHRSTTVDGFVFRGPVFVPNEGPHVDVTVIWCRLDSGITSTGVVTTPLRVVHCELFGKSRFSASVVMVDSNLVQGEMFIGAMGGVFVRGNRFEGGSGHGIHAASERVEITGNLVSGYDSGIQAEGDHVTVASNTITDCGGLGIHVKDRSTTIVSENSVSGCPGGIVVDGSWVTGRRNVVIGTSTPGIVLTGDDARATENVVTSCGGTGIVVQSWSAASADGNTVTDCPIGVYAVSSLPVLRAATRSPTDR